LNRPSGDWSYPVNPNDIKYTSSHEWLRVEADGTATVGITAHAQEALGELVYVELPAVGRALAQGDACVVVESTKAASDVYAPVAGTVIAVNEALASAPQTINDSPYGEGWLFRMTLQDSSQVDALMSAADYGAHEANS
jgi:glycine cleavage system H protein